MNFKYKLVTTVIFFGFGWLVATPAASQQHKKFFFGNKYFVTSTSTSTSTEDSSTSTSTSTLHASASTSTSTKYNKTGERREFVLCHRKKKKSRRLCVLDLYFVMSATLGWYLTELGYCTALDYERLCAATSTAQLWEVGLAFQNSSVGLDIAYCCLCCKINVVDSA